MKWSYTSGIKCVGIACIVVLVLISLYYISVPAVDARRIANMHPDYSNDAGRQVEVRPATVACDLPVGWQTDWRSDLLYLTHYNANGTVAESLSFGSHEDLCDWVEAHPDFCDVNVKKLALQESDTARDAGTAVAMKQSSISQ